ncbi:hypothetical protein VHEMI02869 [[Torrubiella] hemipterigena]|uniref:RING-type domain-containing protein n=1 Tax=[Torrubiella] hemipterigena TaxID=1531966 RepID=A0A0A1T961_9HYPO|nr:hypothetical protein VHEMI02869 [[Torrubiella] hemipterigena]
MRTTRILILILFLTATFFVLIRGLSTQSTTPSRYPSRYPSGRQSFFGFLYYNTPFSLFPPNAAISLTEDNSTSFAARPAAFGPSLASTGLSGPLWVGSGFAEDSVDGNGELGCSDIPGWDGGMATSTTPVAKGSVASTEKSNEVAEVGSSSSKKKSARARRGLAFIVSSDTPSKSETTHKDPSPAHADIQSIQEAAEIEGKIALLMRGGCGFLEKVLWAQRRGAIAVIVGDNTRGGPLIQMYATSEDAEGVVIPSVFTARTTAQLLSSLTQPGSLGKHDANPRGKPTLNMHKSGKTTKPTPHETPIASAKALPKVRSKRDGWISTILGRGSVKTGTVAKKRPDQTVGKDWDPRKDRQLSDKVAEKNTNKKTKQNATPVVDDGFVIGVDDWRDPDLREQPKSAKANGQSATSKGVSSSVSTDLHQKEAGIMRKLFGKSPDDDDDDDDDNDLDIPHEPAPTSHEGLWVTITPTSGASPFFDTLLVLVVSPLVTLSVVYALLILRARIRRRRWRAPKSVVERLPVRTFRTVAISSSLNSRNPSPSGATPTPTTPLLQRHHSSSRPRSRTTTGVPESDSLLIPSSSRQSRGRSKPENEPGAGGFSAEWRKYMGRQVECVVCLEEYVDGVSRVMSLPCGHEFHVDCITPWLTTRRRTCPICKGDVVRSLRYGSQAGPRYEPYHEDSDDPSDDEAPNTRSPQNAADGDLEQGTANPSAQSRVPTSVEEWLSIVSNTLSTRQRVASRSLSPTRRR